MTKFCISSFFDANDKHYEYDNKYHARNGSSNVNYHSCKMSKMSFSYKSKSSMDGIIYIDDQSFDKGHNFWHPGAYQAGDLGKKVNTSFIIQLC